MLISALSPLCTLKGVEIKETEKGLLLEIQVCPGSKIFAIKGFDEWSHKLKISLVSKADNGLANEELIEKFSKIFKTKVTIEAGTKSRSKIILIENLSARKVQEILDENLNK